MIIQSRKYPDKTHDVTLETWNQMKLTGADKKFKVLSSLEYAPNAPVPIPLEVENFMLDKMEVKKIYDEDDCALYSYEDLDSFTKSELIEKYPLLEMDMSMKKDDMINKILK